MAELIQDGKASRIATEQYVNDKLAEFSGGSSGGGTSDYSQLENMPQVNDVTLEGNKTSADLGLADAVKVNNIEAAIESFGARLSKLEKGAVSPAPNDGKLYGMRNGQWEEITNAPADDSLTVSQAIAYPDGSTLKVKGTIVGFVSGMQGSTNMNYQEGLILSDGTSVLKVSDLGSSYRISDGDGGTIYAIDGSVLESGDEVVIEKATLVNVDILYTKQERSLTFTSGTSMITVTRKHVTLDWSLAPEYTITSYAEFQAFFDQPYSGKLVKLSADAFNPLFLVGAQNSPYNGGYTVVRYDENISAASPSVGYGNTPYRLVCFKTKGMELSVKASPGKLFSEFFGFTDVADKTPLTAPLDNPSTRNDRGFTGDLYFVFSRTSTAYHGISFINVPNPNIQPWVKPTIEGTFASHEERTKLDYGLTDDYTVTYHIFDTGAAGPNVIIIGGVHGPEIGSWGATRKLVENFTFAKGKFLIIPNVSLWGKLYNLRNLTTAGQSGESQNINRCYPGNANGNEAEKVAQMITDIFNEFIEKHGTVHLLIDMHEDVGSGAWQKIQYNSSGGSGNVLRQLSQEYAEYAVGEINAHPELTDDTDWGTRYWTETSGGTGGAADRIYRDLYNIPAVTVESPRWEGEPRQLHNIFTPVSLRIQQHEFLAKALVEYCYTKYGNSEPQTPTDVLVSNAKGQYIDLGLTTDGAKPIRMEIDYRMTSSSQARTTLGGCYGTNNNRVMLMGIGASPVDRIGIGMGAISGVDNLIVPADSLRHQIIVETNTDNSSYTVNVDGTITTKVASGTFINTNTWKLFYEPAYPTWTTMFVELFSFKLYNDGILLGDFVPVPQGSTKYSSTPAPSNCLWDMVSQRYFENAGTGEFGIIEAT